MDQTVVRSVKDIAQGTPTVIMRLVSVTEDVMLDGQDFYVNKAF